MSRKKINRLRERFKKGMATSFKKINSSIETDSFLYNEDIEGSIAHTEMLAKQKIISPSEHIEYHNNRLPKKILYILNSLIRDIKNLFTFLVKN